MSDTEQYLRRLQTYRQEIDKALQTLDIPERPEYLYTPLRYVIAGRGKRLRPILLRLVGEAFQAAPVDLLQAGLAVELLHNFTLVHDDIMDDDDTRHGLPTVHKRWDLSTAILTGDGLFALSLWMINRVRPDLPLVSERFAQAALAVCEGQGYDKEFEENNRITLDEYLLMIEKKTGHLLALCSELGARLSECREPTCASLRAYGLTLGKAFQIQDDILEIFSETGTMGKSLGSDITAGKQTVLTVLAREHDAPAWTGLRASLQGEDIGTVVKQVRDYMSGSGILNEARRLGQTLIRQCRDLLKVVPAGQRNDLLAFTEMVLDRKS